MEHDGGSRGAGGKVGYSTEPLIAVDKSKVCPLCNHQAAYGDDEVWTGGRRSVHGNRCLRRLLRDLGGEAIANQLDKANFLQKSADFVKEVYKSLAKTTINSTYEQLQNGKNKKKTLFLAETSLLDGEQDIVYWLERINLFLDHDVFFEKLFQQTVCACLCKAVNDFKGIVKLKADEAGPILQKMELWHQKLKPGNCLASTKKLIKLVYQDLVFEAVRFERDIETMEELCFSAQDCFEIDLPDNLQDLPEIELDCQPAVVFDLVSDYLTRYRAAELEALSKINDFFEFKLNFERLLNQAIGVKIKQRSLAGDLIKNADHTADLAENYHNKAGEDVLSLNGKCPKGHIKLTA